MDLRHHPWMEFDLADGRLTISFSGKAPDGGIDDALEELERRFSGRVTTLLIDKQGQLRVADLQKARSFGTKFGNLLRVQQVRAAVLVDPRDHFETAACVFAMERGARIIAAYSRHEAVQWLDGEIN